MSITIWHNPRCSKSRATLAILEEKGVGFEIVPYLDSSPSKVEIEKVLSVLGIEPRDLMRKGEAVYKENSLGNPDLSKDQLIAAMVAHPILIERPVVINGDKVAIGRPPESVLNIL